MGKYQSFKEFLVSHSVDLSLTGVLFNLLLAALLGSILSWVYIRYGRSLSNRRILGKILMPITMTTMLIITIVKSSLALSLGLVGALSIVRFRTAIKEPEELSYLFLAIGIGLGLGADQRLITTVSILIILLFIILRSFKGKKKDRQNLFLTVNCTEPAAVSLEKITAILEKHATLVNLKRFDETPHVLEAFFQVEFKDFQQLTKTKEEIKNAGKGISISFLDNRGIY
ncbi:MAG: DUF4956 domain-containing protein [Candidatus Aminicenantes bacterium]|jgi:uncharacterized membrane protein YhiD involved in acid resistance